MTGPTVSEMTDQEVAIRTTSLRVISRLNSLLEEWWSIPHDVCEVERVSLSKISGFLIAEAFSAFETYFPIEVPDHLQISDIFEKYHTDIITYPERLEAEYVTLDPLLVLRCLIRQHRCPIFPYGKTIQMISVGYRRYAE